MRFDKFLRRSVLLGLTLILWGFIIEYVTDVYDDMRYEEDLRKGNVEIIPIVKKNISRRNS